MNTPTGTTDATPNHQDAAPGTDDLTVLTDGAVVRPVRGDRTADLDLPRTLAWWTGFRDQLIARSDELHDIGPLLVDAVAEVDTRLADPQAQGDVFSAMASGFGVVPGVGTLLGAWFAEFARCCARDVGSHELADAAWSGLLAVDRACCPAAGAGELLDAMTPAVEALAGADVAGVPAVVALSAAYRAAADGARGTVVDGVVDPGALVVAWFFERGTVV